MITLTDLAADQLRNLILQKDQPGHGLRIFVQGGGCAGLQYGMAFEARERENDTVIEVKGLRLFVDPFSAQYLRDACIDFQDDVMGTGFRVDNPNASVICACGISFRVEGSEEVVTACE
jgi:iron-sulfur cluster assembly accessory protein